MLFPESDHCVGQEQRKDDKEIQPVSDNSRQNDGGFDHPWNRTPEIREELEILVGLLLRNLVRPVLCLTLLRLGLRESICRRPELFHQLRHGKRLQIILVILRRWLGLWLRLWLVCNGRRLRFRLRLGLIGIRCHDGCSPVLAPDAGCRSREGTEIRWTCNEEGSLEALENRQRHASEIQRTDSGPMHTAIELNALTGAQVRRPQYVTALSGSSLRIAIWPARLTHD